MRGYELQVSFWRGKPIAAYLYVFGVPGASVARSESSAEGVVVDYLPDGRPFGIEFITPTTLTLETVNSVLASLRLTPMSQEDLRPLRAA